MYDYLEVVKNDVIDYIEDKNRIDLLDYDDLDELKDHLNDECFNEDSITGNASGSYTFNSPQAKEYVMDNEDLIQECVEEFCIPAETVADKMCDWEYWDVSIRCLKLGEAIEEACEYLDLEAKYDYYNNVEDFVEDVYGFDDKKHVFDLEDDEKITAVGFSYSVDKGLDEASFYEFDSGDLGSPIASISDGRVTIHKDLNEKQEEFLKDFIRIADYRIGWKIEEPDFSIGKSR